MLQSTFTFARLALLASFPCINAGSETSGKRGLAFNTASLTDLFTDFPDITWAYNWGPVQTGLNIKYEFVPMLWSDPTGNQEYIFNWRTGAKAAIATGTTHLLAFNEPDINNLAPAAAAKAYMKFMQPFASNNVQLGAPAVTNGGPPDGFTWLTEFLGNCTKCTIDFVPFHWYSPYGSISYFADYVHQAHKVAGNRPIWLTEFQADNVDGNAPATGSQQTHFMRTVLPWLDSLPFVERYAYFMATPSSTTETFLVDQKGTGLTRAGKTYAMFNHLNGTTPTSLTDVVE